MRIDHVHVHVLVAYNDPDMRDTLDDVLTEAGYSVTRVADGVLALAALWVSRRPLVALLHDGLLPLDASDILELVAADGTSASGSHPIRVRDWKTQSNSEPPGNARAGNGRLRRHRYIVFTTSPPDGVRASLRTVTTTLGTPLLYLPVDLDGLLDTVRDAARDLWPLVENASGLAPSWPEGVARLAGEGRTTTGNAQVEETPKRARRSRKARHNGSQGAQ